MLYLTIAIGRATRSTYYKNSFFEPKVFFLKTSVLSLLGAARSTVKFGSAKIRLTILAAKNYWLFSQIINSLTH